VSPRISGPAARVHRERLTAQLLAGRPARDPVEVARRLLAVQGQDQRGVRLAIRVRSTGLTAADVDRALSEERSLLITWLNRGTLHLVASEDYPAGRVYEVWLKGAGAPQPADALFTVSASGDATVGVPGVVPGIREVMVTAEPLGGSRTPTGRPVIVAHLS
jgi:hypothetical protein